MHCHAQIYRKYTGSLQSRDTSSPTYTFVLRTMHDKPQAVYLESTEVRRRPELIPAACSYRRAHLYAVTSLPMPGCGYVATW